MSVSDGPVCSTNEPYGDSVSTSYNWYITTKGDTIRICTERVIASANAPGYPGQICWGTDGGQTYLYLCVASNQWVRAPFATW